jgi:DNA mismatch repair protein MutL
MSRRIEILDPELASKIAAGEVVERPASVVKELIENSIDAGASNIAVTLVEGGTRLIRVDDDGTGMSAEDAAIAFHRHSTSKVRTEEDLNAIATLGFRGEALASISTVSRLKLQTKEHGAVTGTAVEVEGPTTPVLSPAGCTEGTSIVVRDLFFNTPARLKFLRSTGAEFGRAQEVVKRAALFHSDIRFSLTHGSKKVLETGTTTGRARLGALFGTAIESKLIEIENPYISGYAGSHELNYPTSKSIYLYVNGRPIIDRSLTHAITSAYGSIIDRPRFPFVLLNIIIPPSDVDVNIHPAKSEVRFQNPRSVYDLVRTSIKEALAACTLPLGVASRTAGRPTEYASGASLEKIESTRTVAMEGAPRYAPSRESMQENFPTAKEQSANRSESFDFYGTKKTEINETGDEQECIKSPELLKLRPVGQLWGEFIVAENPGDETDESAFYLIDAHGAAERCAFEALKKGYADDTKGITRQLLLLPEKIETTPEERDALKASLGYLDAFGFEIIEFCSSARLGGETFLVKSVPSILSSQGAASLISDIAEELGALKGSSLVEEKIEEALMRIACHSVIRGPRHLTDSESMALIRSLATIDFAGHCPHGRPVIKRYSRSEIERVFKR